MAEYRIPVEETFSWQRPIIDQLSDPPVSPSKGDRYVVTDTATGDWLGHEKDIAWYDGTTWKFDTPAEGWVVYDKSDDTIYIYDGTAWVAWTPGVGDMTKAVYDTDNDGIVDAAEGLNDGTNTVTAAQAKEAYDRRGTWDADLGCIVMTI